MSFDFYMPTQLISGKGCVENNASLLSELGEHCLVVTSGTAASKSGALADVIKALESQHIGYTLHDSIQQNPLLSDAHAAGETAKRIGADFILGIGGGSPQDAAKVIAIYAANHMAAEDIYSLDWDTPALPIVVVGTTAGTGSEVTKFAVMTCADGIKRSVGHDDCYPAIAFADYSYTSTLPVSYTISTALDALSHSIEGYFSLAANAYTDLFAIEAIKVLYHTLGEIDPTEQAASSITSQQREALYYASITAGMTLSQTGTTYCHSLGYFLSEDHNVPHGIACAVFLPHYVQRQSSYLTEKAEALFQQIGGTQEEFIQQIVSLLPEVSLSLSRPEAEEIVDRYVTSGNFQRTAPQGLSKEEAVTILLDTFQG